MKKIINKMTDIGLIYAIPIALIFIIVLLAYWPGILVSDALVQWHQVQTGEYTTWHPVYNTLYISLLSKICNSPAFVLLVQCCFMAFVVGYFMSRLNKYYSVNKKYLMIASILFALIPVNYNFAVTLLKDTMYSVFVILLSAIMLNIINDKEYLKKWRNIIAILVVLLFISLFRHNGIIVTILFLITMVIMNRKVKLVYVLIAMWIIVYLLLNNVVIKLFNVTEASYANTYGPISHIMARILNDESITLEEQEMEELAKYVDIEKLKSTYDQYNMDYSINSQNIDALKENGSEYMKFAIKVFLKHPLTVIEHYIHLTSFLYSPLPFENSYTVGMFTETDLWLYKDVYPNLEENSKIPGLLEILKKESVEFQTGEVGEILMRPAGYMYISIISMIIIACILKERKVILVLLPTLFNIISLAPAIPVAMTRYVYSTLLLFWFTTTWLLYAIIEKWRKRRNERESGKIIISIKKGWSHKDS